MVRWRCKDSKCETLYSSWHKVMPDYEIKEWNESNFDINSVIWVKEAIQKKKWSLASDYIRHYAIYTEGGIYMDTDVMTYKSFDEFLGNSFFTSVEFHPQGFEVVGAKQIDDKGYAIPYEAGDKKVVKIGANFDGDKRTIERWIIDG